MKDLINIKKKYKECRFFQSSLFFYKNNPIEDEKCNKLLIRKHNILDKKEFVDDFSVRAIKLNKIIVSDPQEIVKKGETITIGIREILVK